jgi:formylglycine-generating enzyme required for sulfatase activity
MNPYRLSTNGINNFAHVLPLLIACLLIVVDWAQPASGISRGPLEPAPGVAKLSEQPSVDSDCPLLPACPGNTPIPLPPILEKNGPEPKPVAPTVDGNNLSEGSGKYQGMVLIPAGTFELGNPAAEGRPDEHPARRISQKEFYLSKNDVTAREFCEFLNSQGENARDNIPRIKLDCPDCPVVKIGKNLKPKEGCADKPVVCVSWYGASDYAAWVGGRLPTSAEWEKAAALTTPYPREDHLAILPKKGSVAVETPAPEVRGKTGMTGNVWQWCSDWYAKDYYSQSPPNNPPGPALGDEKNIRGGSWASAECSKRIRNRHKAHPRGYFRTVGFRVVKD